MRKSGFIYKDNPGLLCCLGFHSWRYRKNGESLERVCMKENCNKREKLYRMVDGTYELWSGKKIPVSHHTFKKSEGKNEEKTSS